MSLSLPAEAVCKASAKASGLIQPAASVGWSVRVNVGVVKNLVVASVQSKPVPELALGHRF